MSKMINALVIDQFILKYSKLLMVLHTEIMSYEWLYLYVDKRLYILNI